jgi:hypothetical protein
MSKPQPNLFALEAPEPIDLMVARRSMPATVRRVVEASGSIQQDPPERADFLHSVLCQVGMPRKKTDGRTFERESGTVSIMLEAGRLWNGRKFVEQPLPYGTRPRLVMVHLSSEAIRTQSRTIEIGESMRDFLLKLDIDPTGGQRGNYTMFRKQMESLAACRLTLGMTNGARAITVDAKPMELPATAIWPRRDRRFMLTPDCLPASRCFSPRTAAACRP